MYDILIRNGVVVDGTGLAAQPADVAIQDGRIAKIGRVRDGGRVEIDAEGHVVTPGFIDGHTHMDAQVMWDQLGTNSCWHGVTSVVMGNCGFSLAPARATERHFVVRNLERAEDISPEAMAAGIEWSWETYPEYLDAVDRQPKAINYGGYIGHSALRNWAMGERAFEEPATADDLAEMERTLAEALRAGALGFTTSRGDSHRTSDDRPVSSRLATWDEVRRLVGVMGQLGAGIFEIAHEAAAVRPQSDPAERADFWERMTSLSRETGVSATFGMILSDGIAEEHFAALEHAAATGAPMFGQATAREFATMLSFKTNLPFDPLPEWRELRSLPLVEQKRLLADPEVRRRLVESADNGGYRTGVGPEVRAPNYDLIYVLENPIPPNRTVAQLAAERGVHPVEVMIDEALSSDFDRMFMHTFGNLNQDAVLRAIKHPHVVTTFSDSGAHVSQIMDASIPTYLLAHWVRNRQEITLEEAVRLLTLVPARYWGFADRGLLREGLVADVNVFDPATVAPRLPSVAADLPGGAVRLLQKADGFRATIVSGQVVFHEGKHTGAFPGRTLRGPLATA